jgi:hypothetical protein
MLASHPVTTRLLRLPDKNYLDCVTREEADQEAKKRWGHYVSAEEGSGPGMRGILTIEKRAAPMITELGRGHTWEEALRCAEHAVWRETHPFNLAWRDRGGLLLLRAECDRCRLISEHRVRMTGAIGENWLERAKRVEQAALKRMQSDAYWLKCPHRSAEVRPDREQLERLARR